MSRIGRVFMFIAASVVSGLALAFIIVAWRPQLVRVPPPPLPPAANQFTGRRCRPESPPIRTRRAAAGSVSRSRCLVLCGCRQARCTGGGQHLYLPHGDGARAAQRFRGLLR